ncbi:MAG: flotillin family protein [Peptococcaceae bacterium]|jgi:flotillin|nr:flotillin family protein [Peptococcaceae bacterium]
MSNPIIIAAVVLGVLALLIIGILSMWRKVPQDKALVITGLKKRVISGGGGLVVPLLERTDAISLENMQISVIVRGLTSTGVDIEVGALTIIKIKNVTEKILAAMEQFNTGDITGTIRNITETSKEVLEGKLREILSGMTVEEIYQNREKFASSVQEVAAKELEDMGLEIKAFTIKEIKDDQGYLDSLGKKQVAEVKKNALIAESNALREQEITIAQNARETAIKTAELQKETAIQLAIAKQQEQESQAEADIKIANATKDKDLIVLSNMEATQKKQAMADVAYQIESNRVQKEIIATQMDAQLVQEEKNVELTKAQMEVQRTREEQETTVAKQKALRRQEELNSEVQKEAEAQAEKIRTMADAEAYRRQKEAAARKYEDIAKAEAEAAKRKLEAGAEAEAVKVSGLAEAQSTEAIGKAKAQAIQAEGLAEAEVIREKAFAEAEAKRKLAEAYKEYGEAAMMEMVVKVLPEITGSITQAIAEPMSKIGQITIVDSGDGAKSVAKVAGYSAELLTQVPAVVKTVAGIDLQSLLRNVVNNVELLKDKSGEGLNDND